ncbi:MAG: hypothetical protein J1E83_02485 [Lachnospiraceae bacterium]|nr:hypothetical protein [Lachnospiraceae bacterium]
MPKVKTCFLIDFESVHDRGLSGSNKLESHDEIHIFYTENASKVNMKMLGGIKPFFHEVPAGNQSLDKHLVAYLGFMVGKNASDQCRYVIISKDKGYEHIISFLKKECSSKIVRKESIDDSLLKNSVSKSNEKKLSEKTVKNGTKANSKQKQQINKVIIGVLLANNYQEPYVGKIASIFVKYCKDVNKLDNELKGMFPDYYETELYSIVHDTIKKLTRRKEYK